VTNIETTKPITQSFTDFFLIEAMVEPTKKNKIDRTPSPASTEKIFAIVYGSSFKESKQIKLKLF